MGSILFYAWGGPIFIFLLLLSLSIDFFFIRWGFSTARKRTFLWIGVFLNVAMLAYFKYANFFVENLNQILETLSFHEVAWTNVILPIGISFFTFQKISYLVDVYRSDESPVKKWADYALYVLLFPQLIAGPIVRFKEVAKHLVDRKENIHLNGVLEGLWRFSFGLGKKVLIANPLGEIANSFIDSPYPISSGEGILGLLCYSFQIYFDFSGYSDMAIGLGKMLGFKFPENFNLPYLSRSITEFWRRWHITLSSWMRDYLYIPLGGNRVSLTRTYLNLAIVFLLSGLWHGASWNFIIWGGFHGFFLILERAFLLRWLKGNLKYISGVYTFLVVVIGWSFFRIEQMVDWQHFMDQIVQFRFNKINLEASQWFVVLLGVFIAFAGFIRRGKDWGEKFWTHWAPTKPVFTSLIGMLFLVLSTAAILGEGYNPFIYFRF